MFHEAQRISVSSTVNTGSCQPGEVHLIHPQAGAMPLLSSMGQRLDIWKALSKEVLVTAWENANPATKSRQGSIKGQLLS